LCRYPAPSVRLSAQRVAGEVWTKERYAGPSQFSSTTDRRNLELLYCGPATDG